ncbi:MAG TPA: citrate (Si)-synthase, partial [Chlamydiales bacterium]
MKEGVLFEITKDQLETGLRGVPVGYCVTSFVDPMKGLTYVGRPISELASLDPMSVIYLLYHGEAGTKSQLEAFEQDLSKRAACHPDTIRHIESLPKTGHSMDLFAAALLITGMTEGEDNYREDCLNAIAKLPHIAAAVINSHAGWGPTPPPNPRLSYIENFLHMLKFPGERKPSLTEVMKVFEVVHLDHCGGNLSTFVGKAVASGLENLWGSLAAAMTALAGPRHGRANQDCLEFVQEVLDTVGEDAKPADVEQLVRKKLKNKELVFGFGHAVLRVEDPRAAVFYRFAEKHFAHHPLIKIALMLRTEGPKVLKENPKVSDPYPNIDAITGSLLMAAGFPYPEYYTVLFGLSR